jgi:hypothetical protein
VTNDQLGGSLALALGLFEAWRIYSSIDTGKWIISYLPKISIGRGAHPISFWVGVTWDVFVMMVLLYLGAYFLAPLILPRFGL